MSRTTGFVVLFFSILSEGEKVMSAKGTVLYIPSVHKTHILIFFKFSQESMPRPVPLNRFIVYHSVHCLPLSAFLTNTVSYPGDMLLQESRLLKSNYEDYYLNILQRFIAFTLRVREVQSETVNNYQVLTPIH